MQPDILLDLEVATWNYELAGEEYTTTCLHMVRVFQKRNNNKKKASEKEENVNGTHWIM